MILNYNLSPTRSFPIPDSSLVLVGSGIKFISHLTTETKAYIEQSDKVLYLVNEPAIQKWIQQNSTNSESLDFLYTKHTLRIDCYREITNYILMQVRKNQHVCVVLYGHPTVFAQPGLNAILQAQVEGYYTKVLPGISAEDCLFADLLINPGSCGCQSFEATDFLVHQRIWDSRCHLILWQVSVIGLLGHASKYDNRKGASLLLSYLRKHYDISHNAILYEAAQYPGFEPKIIKISLAELPEIEFPRLASLYIPPLETLLPNKEVLKALEISES